jgi:Cu(I)/Ag(I) efflux system membrane fusion protein
MTSVFNVRRLGPLASAALTAALIFGGLWVQHARVAWPFGEPAEAAAIKPVAAPTQTPPTNGRVPIEVGAAAAQDLGVQLEVVRRTSLNSEIRAVATVAPDESRISHVHTRVSGWVEQLDVNTTGEFVKAGQPLARIFSQELLSSQTEYLAARSSTTAAGIASAVVAGGRMRLGVLGMTPEEIDVIEQTGQPRRLITVVAPRSGIVVNRGVTVGTSVDPSTTLLTIADLSRVWILAEVPEVNIPGIHIGSAAQLDFAASGLMPFASRVDFLYPTLSERTRTLRVRFSAANPGGSLRPGLYGTATFESTSKPVITVPRDAIVDTGVEQHVFVAKDGMFEPRVVALGLQLADRVEIREGLTQGEQVVAAGVFLLDSESRLRATGNMGGHNHGSSGTTEKPSPASPADPHDGHKR